MDIKLLMRPSDNPLNGYKSPKSGKLIYNSLYLFYQFILQLTLPKGVIRFIYKKFISLISAYISSHSYIFCD